MPEDEMRARRIEAEVVVRTRRIELVDDEGNLVGVLDGGERGEGGERGFAGLILYGPDAGTSAATIAMHRESGKPSVHLYTVGGGDIIVYFDADGRAVVRMENEDGTVRELTPQ